MPTVLAIAAHPDDIEFLMAGTLLRLSAAGYEVHYLNLADGCCGTTEHSRQEIARVRLAEARQACELIGARFHEPMTGDLEIFYEPRLLAKVASIVRQVSPTIVLTHALADYMEDHTSAARLAVTATFARGMPNFPVDPPREAVAGEAVLYHAQPYGNRDPMCRIVRPEIFVDIARVHATKRAMLACHTSQKRWLDESQGLDSYLQTVHDLDAQVGQMSGRFELAEGWRRHLHLGFGGPKDDPLADALGPLAWRDPAYEDALQG